MLTLFQAMLVVPAKDTFELFVKDAEHEIENLTEILQHFVDLFAKPENHLTILEQVQSVCETVLLNISWASPNTYSFWNGT